MVHTWPWKRAREWKNKEDEEKTQKLRDERRKIADAIENLASFNSDHINSRVLAMLSGDLHMLAYDHGGRGSNPFGYFPIFQCSPLDKRKSFDRDGQYSSEQFGFGGQYCTFTLKPNSNCLLFQGFSYSEKILEWNSCNQADLDKRKSQDIEFDNYLKNMDKQINELEAKNDGSAQNKQELDTMRRYVDYAEEFGYGHEYFDYPMKPKDKAALTTLMFSIFYGLWILWNVCRKLLPNMIE